jgi:hypothetical protein
VAEAVTGKHDVLFQFVLVATKGPNNEAPSSAFGGGFTVANALAALLTTESLLFAAFGIAVNFSTVGQRRIRKLPVSAQTLGAGCVIVLAGVAFGASVAWGKIFLSPFPSAFYGVAIAIALLLAIVAQPIIAALLALGLRTLS